MQTERSVPSLTQQQFEAVTRLKGQNKGVSRVNMKCCCFFFMFDILLMNVFYIKDRTFKSLYKTLTIGP